MLKCETPRYDALYARWLERPGELLDLASYDPARDQLLDVCGGTGAVSREALRRRAALRPVLVDLAPRCPDHRVLQVRGDVHTPGLLDGAPAADVVVIRQAMAYLDPARLAAAVAPAVRRGGRLAFNTFDAPRGKALTYRHGGRRFFELSVPFRGRVVHVQACLAGVDVSLFRHRFLGDVLASMAPWFHPASVTQRGRGWHVLMERSRHDATPL